MQVTISTQYETVILVGRQCQYVIENVVCCASEADAYQAIENIDYSSIFRVFSLALRHRSGSLFLRQLSRPRQEETMTITSFAAKPFSSDDLVRREVHYCVSYLVSTLAGADYDHGADNMGELMDQAQELCYGLDDYEEAAFQEGWTVEGDMFVNHRSGTTASDASPLDGCGWEDVCREFDIEPYQREVFEHWIVSDWLADKLEAQGEKVARDFGGMTVWARTTTGQGIASDYVIERIAADLSREG